MLWFILIILGIVASCYVTYKTAEVHELHKMRAAFEYRKHAIEKVSNTTYNSEIEGLNDAINIVDIELDNLKTFDLN